MFNNLIKKDYYRNNKKINFRSFFFVSFSSNKRMANNALPLNISYLPLNLFTTYSLKLLSLGVVGVKKEVYPLFVSFHSPLWLSSFAAACLSPSLPPAGVDEGLSANRLQACEKHDSFSSMLRAIWTMFSARSLTSGSSSPSSFAARDLADAPMLAKQTLSSSMAWDTAVTFKTLTCTVDII